MIDRRGFLSLSAAFASVAASRSWAQTGGGVPEGYPADYASIIEGSKQESRLLLYSSIATPQWEPVTKAFKTVYPWVNIELLELDSGEVIQRFFAEVGTNTQTADLLVTPAPDAWLGMMERDLILPYASPETAIYPEWSHPTPGLYTFSVDALPFLWNKALLPKELHPTSFADLVEKAAANPDVFRGKIATYGPHLTSMGYSLHYGFVHHHGEKAWEWYETLAPFTGFERAAGPMVDKVTSGEYLIVYFSAARATRVALRDPARAQILEASYISDGNPLLMMSVALPKVSTNSNSAKLFLDFLLSVPGQKTLPDAGRTVFHPELSSADVGGADTYKSITDQIGQDNAAVVYYDPAMLTNYDAFMARFKAINGL